MSPSKVRSPSAAPARPIRLGVDGITTPDPKRAAKGYSIPRMGSRDRRFCASSKHPDSRGDHYLHRTEITWKDAFVGATQVRIPARSNDPKRRRPRNDWAGLYLFVTALVVPLVYSNATIDPVLLPGFLVVSLLGIAMVAAYGVGIVRSKETLTVNRAEAIVIGCLIAYILVAAISVLIAGPTPDGNFELLKLARSMVIHASSRASARTKTMHCCQARTTAHPRRRLRDLQYYKGALVEW